MTEPCRVCGAPNATIETDCQYCRLENYYLCEKCDQRVEHDWEQE